MLITLAGLLYVAVLILLTNASTDRALSHRYLRFLEAAMPLIIGAQLLSRIFTYSVDNLMQLSYLLFAGISLLFMALLIGFELPGRLSERIIRLPSVIDSPAYSSRRPTHRLALLLVIFTLAVLFWRYSGEGGLQDLLSAYATTEGAVFTVIVNMTVYLTLALLGVGWLVRRDRKEAFERLGLRFPTRLDSLAGVALGCALFVGVSLITSLWQNMAPASTFEWQTAAARQIFDSIRGSIIVGALVMFLVALGEEALFRGALQPVFGVVFVSLVFTAIHIQYAFTPAAAIVFLVSLAFGLARARLSTTAAIISHFVYNLIPILLASLV